MREEAARKERQRKQVIAAVAAVVVIIAAVAIGAVVANRPRGSCRRWSTGSTASADAALAKLVALPQATLDASPAPDPNQAPAKLQGGTALTQDGKPKVLYVGAEYCPFCAMERWALIGALSKFGTFNGLKPTTSASDDVHPDTPTWTFAGSTYTSDVLAFEAVETADREKQPLQPLEGENAAIFQKYNPDGGIPWITYGGTCATTAPRSTPTRSTARPTTDHRGHRGPHLRHRQDGQPGHEHDQRPAVPADGRQAEQRLHEPGRPHGLRAAQAVTS